MADVLITHSYFLRFDPKQWKAMQPYPPLGTLYAVSALRDVDLDVCFFDNMFSIDCEGIKNAIRKERPSIFVICDDGFNYLTKMCLSNMRHAAYDMIRFAAEQGCKVIVSSSDATDHAQAYIDRGADFIVMGEGEKTLRQLTKALLAGVTNDYSLIDGLTYQENGQLKTTAKRNVINNLDELPLPAWDVIDIDQYKYRWLRKHGYFSLNMVTTRGCPYKCNWCAKPIYGNRYNSHSPQRIVDELEQLIEHFHPDHIWFSDDIFGLKPGWIREFASLANDKKLQFKFKIQSRADLLVQEETVKALADAGCQTVWIGTESGSQKILDAMDKGITVEQIYKATELLRKYHIDPCFFLQFGYLGETLKDIELTIKMIHDLLPEDIGISVSYPLPGTVFYDKVKGELKSKANWVDSDDLDLMFKNTYASPFYKRLHRYVHKTYREHQALNYLKNIFTTEKNDKLFNYKRVAALPYYFIMSKVEKYRLHLEAKR
ncbi:MAG: B12-binding radical protein [Chitinophagaceae bacterium]|nr:B12-binding radical protein [Chitinophagaceae bacterium]